MTTSPPGGTIPPNTLATARALRAQIAGLQAQLDQLVTAAVEGAGHDIDKLQLKTLDLATGQYTLAPRPASHKAPHGPPSGGPADTAPLDIAGARRSLEAAAGAAGKRARGPAVTQRGSAP